MKLVKEQAADVDELREAGFTILPGFLTPLAIDTFEETMRTLGQRLAERRGLAIDSGEAILDLLKIGGAYRELLFLQLKYLRLIQRISAEIGEVLETSGLDDALGLEVPLVWPTLRADPPDEGTYLLPMHQDYKSVRSHRAWRMWIPMRPVDETFGTIKLVPGSHRSGVLPHDLSEPGHPRIESAALAGLPERTLRLPAGDAVIFNPLLAHASVPNVSDRIKYVLLIQIQDHAAMIDPDDPDDDLAGLLNISRTRDGEIR